MTAQARMIDAIPVVADSTARDAWWPSATRPIYARVFRIDTNNVEQWDGSAWNVVIGTAETPIAPTLLNSWTSLLAVRYWKQRDGVVRFRGQLGGGGLNGTIAFVLPVGYRPPQLVAFTLMQTFDGTVGFLSVDPSGNVTLFSTGAKIPALDVVSFRVDA